MKLNTLYIADGPGARGGGSPGATAAGAALDDGDGDFAGEQHANGDGGSAAGGGAPAAPAKPELTAESLAQAMKAAGMGQAAPAPAAPAKEYSQADFDKAFHVVRPNEDQVKALLAGGSAAVQTITDLLHAAAKQAVVMSAYQLQEFRDKIQGDLTPLQQWRQEKQELEMRERFVKDNEDLKGYEAVGEEVLKAMQTEGLKFKDEKEAFKALRDRIIKTIKSVPGFEQWEPPKPGVGGTPGKQQSGTRTQMTTLSRGGGSGGAAAGQGGQSKVAGAGQSRGAASNGAAVFD